MRYQAIGIVEVTGSANAILVADKMLKTAQVYFRTWDYRCGGHVCVFVYGDISAVTSVVEAVKEAPPCEIVLAGVISSPSEETSRIIDERAKRFHFA